MEEKTITIVVPTYNEEKNVQSLYLTVKSIFQNELPEYKWKILFIDNASIDCTQQLITDLANKDEHIQAIFNSNNVGFSRSSFYGLSQADGDCAIMLYADLQDPPEMIPQFVREWEKGHRIVIGIKSKSKENPLMYLVRGVYYKILEKIAEFPHIKQFDGFGLYDKMFIELLRRLDDPLPYLRGIVAECGGKLKMVEYTQEKRKAGKTSFNFARYYDVAMLGITSSSRGLMRVATFTGVALGGICLVVALVTFIIKITNWNFFNIGTAAMLIGIFFLGAIQLFFLGFVGEYVANINARTMKHPIVVEEKRINMDTRSDDITEKL